MKKNRKLTFLFISIVLMIFMIFSVYLFAFWDVDFDESRVNEVASKYMTEIYSYDYVLAGKYLNDFLDENYRTQINHKFLDTERVTCIFGVNDEGKNILLVKTWRVFGGNYIVELDDYYNYEEAISHILSVYSNLEVNAVSMEIMMEEVNIDSDIVYYIGFLVNHGDHYSRFIFYYDQVVELDGRNSF